MKKSVLFIGIIIFFLISCRKDDTQPVTTNPNQETVSDYFPLKEGNYWVYKRTLVDSSGTILLNTYDNDSIIVKNDTLINNKIYHQIFEYSFSNSTFAYIYFYRDSANFIVNQNGTIILSIKPGFVYKRPLIADTSLYINYYFVNQTTNITLTSGIFNCVDFKGEFYSKSDNFTTAKLIHNYYYKNIGSIKSMNRFAAGYDIYQLELLRYKLN
jgi:hypothetical protein